MAGHNFAARSCCDLDLQGSDPNVVCDTLSQYGEHFCKKLISIKEVVFFQCLCH